MFFEDFINKTLIENGIITTNQLNVKDLAEVFNINLYYWNCGTRLISEEELYCVIDISKNPIIQYEEFLHELAHFFYTKDIRSLNDFSRWKHIEGKVKSIVPYIAIPKFALKDLKKLNTIYEAADHFNISPELVMRRIQKGV